jgi:hypothetical protein
MAINFPERSIDDFPEWIREFAKAEWTPMPEVIFEEEDTIDPDTGFRYTNEKFAEKIALQTELVKQAYELCVRVMKDVEPSMQDTMEIFDGMNTICASAKRDYYLKNYPDMVPYVRDCLDLAEQYLSKWIGCFQDLHRAYFIVCLPLARRALDDYLRIPE